MKQSILSLVLILLSATVASGQAAPSVIATMPADAAKDVSINTIIKATFSDDMDASTITRGTFTLGGVIGNVIYVGPSKTATFIPFTYLANATSYTATITTGVKDVSGNNMASDYLWTFSTTSSSTVIAVDPSPNAKDVSTNPVITATFDRDMDPATVGQFNFWVSTTITFAGFSYPYYYFPGKATYDAAMRTATFTLPGENLLPGTVNTVTIYNVKDVSGNIIPPYAWSFTTGGSPPPTVTTTDPFPGAKDVALSTKVQITFSKDMDPATINGDTLSLRLPPPPNAACIGICLGKTVAGTMAYEAVTKTAVFTPSADLKTGTKYTAVLIAGTKGVHDTSGNKIPVYAVEDFEGFAWTYTTTGTPPPPPTVTATDPPDKAQGVSLNPTVKITFDKDMDGTTIDCYMWVPNPSFDIIGGKITYDAPTRTATFVPSKNLKAGTTYRLEIMASDTSDNYMAGYYESSFTTVGAPPGGDGGGGGGGNSCFIATAAYGSFLHPHVVILRCYRDSFLITNNIGRSFVAGYYRVSPSIADAIRTSEITKAGVRIALLPVVGISYLSLTIGVAPTLLILLLFLAVICLGIRKLYLYRRDCLS